MPKRQQISKNAQMCDTSPNLSVLIVEPWHRFQFSQNNIWGKTSLFRKKCFFFRSYIEKQGGKVWPCFRSPTLWPQMFAQKSHPRLDVNKAWVTFHQASSVFHNLLPLKALQDATHLLLNSVSSNTQWTPGVYLACPSPFFYFYPSAENSVRGFLWHERRKFKFTPINALQGVALRLHLPAEWQKNPRRQLSDDV